MGLVSSDFSPRNKHVLIQNRNLGPHSRVRMQMFMYLFFQQWCISALNVMLHMVKFPVCFVTYSLFTKQLEGLHVKNVIIEQQEKITFVNM